MYLESESGKNPKLSSKEEEKQKIVKIPTKNKDRATQRERQRKRQRKTHR